MKLIFIFLAAALIGCGNSPSGSPAGLPVTSMQIGSKTYDLEIAGDETSRDHGLMERDAMPSSHGMVFIFPTALVQSFWMHHTRFPLDIIFADDQKKIVSIHTMKAYDESTTSSDKPARYAIELNAGEAASDGAKIGDELHMPPVVDSSLKN